MSCISWISFIIQTLHTGINQKLKTKTLQITIFKLEDFEPINIGAANRKIYSNNGVKFIYAKRGDTYFKIAQDFDIYTYQIRTYNDMRKKDEIKGAK